jgi:predicted secreted acid phosphatase
MYKKILLVFLLSIFGATSSFALEPKNLDLVKADLRHYHDSGAYPNDQTKVIDRAMEYLKTRIASEKFVKHKKPLAIVLDIDETALSNYPDMLELSFGGTFNDIINAEGKGADPVIQPTLNLYRYAKANNVAIFFVTGRTERFREATLKNLEQAGYKDIDGLILKPENYRDHSAAPYKIAARKTIESQGYTIVLNIGDQKSDLLGKHAEKTFKLPNPYYLIP